MLSDFGMKRKKSTQKPEQETPLEATVAPLSDEEQQQFATWLKRQPDDRRACYLKLAQAYGFNQAVE